MRIRKILFNKLFIFISLFFLILNVVFLAYLTPGLKGSIEQEIRIFFKQNDRIISSSITQSIKNIYTSVRYKRINENRYEKLKINISFVSLKTLKKERKKALSQKINLSRKKVPIEIVFNNEVIKASARLKGVLADHYGNNKQFSMMIKLKNGKSIDGMKEFALTQHYSRQYPQNVIYSEILSEVGLATPRFITYKIDLNGEDWGLMLAEEQYSNAYMELRKKKYSPIIKFTNEDNSKIFRLLHKDFKNTPEEDFIDFLNSKHGKIENSIYNKKDFNNFYFSNILSYIKDTKFDLLKNKIPSSKLDSIFDMDKFSKIFILSLISGEYHALGYRNMRFYINPFTKKFEPIPTDWGEPNVRKIKNRDQLENELFNLINCKELCNRQDYPLYNMILKNHIFVEKFNYNLKIFGKTIENTKLKLEALCKYQINTCKNNFDYLILKNNLKILAEEIDYEKILSKNYQLKNKKYKKNISKSIKKKYLNIIDNPIYVRAFKDGKIKILNLTPYNIEIDKVKIIKKNCKNNCIESYDNKISIPVNEFEYLNYDLKKKLENYEGIFFNIIHESKNLKSSKFKIENVNFKKLENYENQNLNNFKIIKNDLIINSGITHIKKPLILPKNLNLKISAGATIIFNKGTYIKIVGGNIEALGTKSKKIYFKPYVENQVWNGILVSESKNRSLFNNVVFQNLNYFQSSNIHLTGGINFYKSDVNFVNTEFISSIAEDFLNITNSSFIIKNSKFSNCISDALDSDFSSGEIINTKFTKINGDAADFSGSKVKISNSLFNLVADKSISAGENSQIISIDNSFSNSKIAIASKDQSVVEAYNNQFLNSTLYDLIAFNKKSFYAKGGEIYLTNKSDKNQLKIKSDLYSKILINGSKVKNEKIDLKSIY